MGFLAERGIRPRFVDLGILGGHPGLLVHLAVLVYVSSEVADNVVTWMREVGTFGLGDASQ